MKKIILSAIIGAFSFSGTLFAQERPTFIVQGGAQFSNLSNLKDNKLKTGYRVGVGVDIPILSTEMVGLSLQPSLNYVSRGFSLVNKKSDAKSDNCSTTMNYVELPILANVRFGVGEAFNVFLNAGPYFAYGIGGKVQLPLVGEKDFNPFKKHEFFGKEYSFANSFDAGLQVGAGIEVSRFMVGVSAQYGLTNVIGKNDNDALKNNLKDKDSGNRNTSFFATVGYRF